MNRSYRLIWSRRVNALVVVSEFTRGQGKGGAASKAVLAAAAATLLGLAQPAVAETITTDEPDGVTYDTTIPSFDNQATIANGDIAVNVTGDVTGNFNNSGTIQSGHCHGVFISGSVGGDFTNAATGYLRSGQWGYGAKITGNVSGSISNAGNMLTGGHGLIIEGDLGGGFTNTGRMHSQETLLQMTNPSSVLTGDITNSGTMISSRCHGVFTEGSMNGNFTNTASGRIVTHEMWLTPKSGWTGSFNNAGTMDSSSHGIYISAPMTGDFTNTGTLRAEDMLMKVIAPEAQVTRYWFDNGGGFFPTYEDLIAASSDGLAGAYPDYVRAGNALTGNIFNSGKIHAYDSHGFFLEGALEGNFTNAAGGRMVIAEQIFTSNGAGTYQPVVYCQNPWNFSPSNPTGGTNCYWRDTLVPNAPAVSGNIVNAGTLVSGDSHGFVIKGDLAGDFTNSGRLLVNDIAMWVDGRVRGNIVNDGDIISGASVGMEFYSSSALPGITGNFTNNGKILTAKDAVTIISSTAAAAAEGAWAIDGNFTNNGLLGAGHCHGLAIYGAMRGDFLNSQGAHIVAAHGFSANYAPYGSYSLVGNLTNRGEIVAGDYSAIDLDYGIQGNVLNAATGRMYGNQHGIFVGGALAGNFTNEGRIYGGDSKKGLVAIVGGMTGNFSNLANAVIQNSTGNGVAIGATLSGNFDNAGTIIGGANQSLGMGDSYQLDQLYHLPSYLSRGPMVGVLVNGDVTGTFTNSGTIRAAQGVFITGDLTGGWINTGSIYGGFTGKIATADDLATLNLIGSRVLTGDAAVIGGNFSGNFTTGVGQGILVGSYTHNWEHGDGENAAEDTTVNLEAGTGTATLTGATVSVHVGSGSYANNYSWTGIDANSIVGFGGTVTDNSSLYNFTATVDGNNDLVFTTIKLDQAAPTAVVNFADATNGVSVNGPQVSFSNEAGALILNGGGHAVEFTAADLGAFSNAGRIVATDNNANAVAVSGDLNGNFTNASTGHISAREHVIVVTGNVNGDILNDGEIVGVFSKGIVIGGNLVGNVTNSATGYFVAPSDLLSVSGSMTGHFTNAGFMVAGYQDYGVLIGGNLNGNFTNSAHFYAGKTLLRVNGDLLGNLSNTGLMTSAQSIAVNVEGQMVGNFTNGAGATLFAKNEGLKLNEGGTNDEVGLSGSISNDGTIVSGECHALSIKGGITGNFTNSATGKIFGNDMALNLRGQLNGNFSNAGEMISGDSHAVFVSGMMTGNFTNAAGALIWANDHGVILSSGITGNFNNAGEISTGGSGVQLGSLAGGSFSNASTGSIAAESFGVVVCSTLAGNFTNQGEILSMDCHGVFVGGLMTGDFTNSADARILAEEMGVALTGGLSGSFSNAGSIYSGSHGVYISGTVVGNFTNASTGVIGSKDDAVLLRADEMTGNISNAGEIYSFRSHGVVVSGLLTGDLTNTSSGNITAQENGLHLNNITGNINNAGEITSLDSYGVSISGALSGNFDNTGTITGQLRGLSLQTTASTGTYTNAAGAEIVAASSAGVGVYVDTAGVMSTLNNAGLIAGGDKALDLQNAADAFAVNNSGTLQGDVYLGLNTLNLNGDAARVIGDTSNTGGTVNVNGEFTSEGFFDVDNFNITADGLFHMRHAIGGNNQAEVSNLGILELGIATRNITGTYTQGADATLRFGLTGSSTYGTLNVSGNATIDDGSTIDVVLGGTPGARIDGVLVAGGTLSADPGTLVVTDGSALYDFTASTERDSQELDLITEADSDGITSAAAGSDNPAIRGVAGALQTMFNDGVPEDMQPVFDLLGVMTPEELNRAFSLMLPSVIGAGSQAGINALHSMNKIIQSRIESNRGLSSGEASSDGYFWLRAFGNRGDQDDYKGVAGYESSTEGIVLGADKPLTDRIRAGGAFTYARSDIEGNDNIAPSQIDVDTYELVGYASYNLDEFTDINLQLDLGLNKADSNRVAFGGGTARADFDSHVIHLSAGIGRTIPVAEHTTMTPSIRLDVTRMRTEGYTERGATIPGSNLHVDSSTYRELLLTADAKLSHQFGNGLKFVGNASVGYDFENEQTTASSSFVGGGPSFVTEGLDSSPWVYRGGLGLIKETENGTELSARYDAESRSSEYLNQTFSVKVRWMF